VRPKTLTKAQESELIRAFHHKNMEKTRSYPQLWYEVVMEWLSWKFEGAELVTRSVRDAENKILQSDAHSREYISTLMKLVLPDDNEARSLTEHQKMVLLITASCDDRERAIHLIQA
jgi:hypothetical protein